MGKRREKLTVDQIDMLASVEKVAVLAAEAADSAKALDYNAVEIDLMAVQSNVAAAICANDKCKVVGAKAEADGIH